MARDHLRHQAGGNPAQGPTPDMANPTPGPAAGDDFPDAPERSDGPIQDQPDLDDFAARLGLTDDTRGQRRDNGGEARDTHDDGPTIGLRSVGPRVAAVRRRATEFTATEASRLAAGIGRLASRMAKRSERLAERLRPDDRHR